MIAAHGALVAHLGGPRGDRLSIALGTGPLAPRADLGWAERAQGTPQRRLWTDGEEIWVLEPSQGLRLGEEVRLRRFSPQGAELPGGSRAVAEERGSVPLAYVANALDAAGRTARLVRLGLDPARGLVTRSEETVAARGWRWPPRSSGIPARSGDAWWYPVGDRGLVRVDAGGDRLFRGVAGAPALLGGSVAVPGYRGRRAGVWLQGAWRPVPGVRPFAPGRPPLSPLVAPHGNGGLVLLSRSGGPLGVLDAPPLRLPPGIYGGLVKLGARLLAVEEQDPPRLVAPGF